MIEKKKTLKERRMESDGKIIDSAIRCFGHNGYTHTSIKAIAEGAGVTGGLLTQRYGTKENLFFEAYCKVMEVSFAKIDANVSPRECLKSIVANIENLADANPDAFEFCTMLHNASDYPKACLAEAQQSHKTTVPYETLKEAQKKGMLPAGNLDELLAAFGAAVFANVKLCRKYNLEYPGYELYLDIIRFKDEASLRNEKWRRILETAITNTFELLVYIDIAGNSGEMLRCSGKFSLQGTTDDIRAEIESAARRDTSQEDTDRILEYMNLDTLGERIKGRKSLSCKMTMFGQTYVHTFIPLSWDENGNLTEVFAGLYAKNEG